MPCCPQNVAIHGLSDKTFCVQMFLPFASEQAEHDFLTSEKFVNDLIQYFPHAITVVHSGFHQKIKRYAYMTFTLPLSMWKWDFATLMSDMVQSLGIPSDVSIIERSTDSWSAFRTDFTDTSVYNFETRAGRLVKKEKVVYTTEYKEYTSPFSEAPFNSAAPTGRTFTQAVPKVETTDLLLSHGKLMLSLPCQSKAQPKF